MSRLEELIEKLCPEGVEYIDIGSCCEIKTGKGITKQDAIQEGEYPIISGGKEPMGWYSNFNRTAFTTTISRVGANAGFVNYIDVDFYLNDKCFSVIPCKNNKINSRFLYYVLKNKENEIVGMQSEGGVPTINTQKVGSIEIPIPPIEVQSEIVRILDNFTELTAELTVELTVELTARKKQYEYYRDELLTKSTKYPLTTLDEICEFVRGPFGGSLKKEIFCDSGYAVYEQQHAIYGVFTFRYFVDELKYNEMKRFAVNAGDLIMSCSGTMGKISIIPDNAPKGIINQALLKLTPKNNVLNKYLKYCFENTIALQMNAEARGGAIKNVASVSELKKITINLPPLEEQQRIVDILDRFDKLCNDISEGLPAEIEARQKQYEYYRDKLLTFKEKAI